MKKVDRNRIKQYLEMKRYDCHYLLDIGWCRKSDCKLCSFDGNDILEAINIMCNNNDYTKFEGYTIKKWLYDKKNNKSHPVYLFQNFFVLLNSWLKEI